MNRDFFAGLVGLCLAVGYYALAADIPDSQLADEVGPAGLPKLYGLLLGGFSLVLMARALWRPAAAPAGARAAAQDLFAARRAAGVLAIGVAYVALVPWLGYPLGIALVIAGAALYQGGRMSREFFAVAVLGAFGLWFVFVFLLHIGQPAGIWPELIGGLWR